MKKRLLFRNSFQTVAVLLFTAVMSLTFSACSEMDNPVEPAIPNANPLAKQIAGAWYGEYEIQGTVPGFEGNDPDVKVVTAVQYYVFNEDGTGVHTKFLLDESGNPVMQYGSMVGANPEGTFTYTTKANGMIEITKEAGEGELPQQWTLYYVDGGISGGDDDYDYDFNLHTATESETIYVKNVDASFHGGGTVTDDEAYGGFIANWDSTETVPISGLSAPVYTPWRGSQKWNIPDDIRLDVRKADGWEMAFCMLNDQNAQNCHMFGLYNRFTGILKVFHYIIDPKGYGNDLVYRVTGGSTLTDDKYPLYHSMEYGIPTCHAYGSGSGKLNPGAKIYAGQVQQNSFTAFVTPFSDEDTHTPRTGWQCFTIDLSGYTPAGVDWKRGRSYVGQLNLITQTSNQDNVSLAGSLTGKLSGTVTDQKVIKHGGGSSTAGFCTALTTISSLMTGGIGSVNSAYSLAKNDVAQGTIGGGALGAAAPWMAAAGFAMNITAAIIKAADTPDPTWEEVIPGKIDLGLDASINLNGTIGGLTANSEGGISLTPELMDKASAQNQHLGTGVWGLAEDPVIYISKDDMFSVNDHLNVIDKGNGTYGNDEFDKSQVRLLSFFDPASIKINLNTSLFHNIRDVTIKANYAVYTDRQTGYTDSYRQFLGFGERPSFALGEGGKNQVSRLVGGYDNDGPRIHCLKPEDALIKDFESAANCAIHVLPGPGKQKGDSIMRLYGRKYSFNGKELVCFPQVYVPYVKGGAIYDPVAPDFVVSVELAFECDEGKMLYTKTFVPQVKLIGHNDLDGCYDRLKAYAQKCANKEAIGTLANDASIPVRDVISDLWLTRTLKMLEVATGKSAGSTPDRHWLKFDIIKNITLTGVKENVSDLGVNLNGVCLAQSSWRHANDALFGLIQPDTHKTNKKVRTTSYVPSLASAREIGKIMHNDWDGFANAFKEAGKGPLNKGYEYWIDHTHQGGFLNGITYIDYFSFWDYNQKEESLYGAAYTWDPGEKYFFFFDWRGDSVRDGASVGQP